MKLFLTCMTAACALGVAAPAAAQYVNANAGGTVGVENRIAQLETQIQAGVSAGSIDRTEAWRLRQELRQLQRSYSLYSRNGLTVQERTDLQTRFRNLRQNIRLADGGATDRYGNNNVYQGQRYDSRGRVDVNGMYDRNGNRIDAAVYGSNVYQGERYDSRGRVDVNGMYDRYGNRIDTSVYGSNVYQGQRYDSRGRIDPEGMYDRNGNRIPDAVYGQGGPYEEVCTDRGGIGGIIDDLFGTDQCGAGSLRVGQRVSSNLSAVPYEYRNQYRDGNGYYYRSDGRSIYQIDARTQTVIRVYDMNR